MSVKSIKVLANCPFCGAVTADVEIFKSKNALGYPYSFRRITCCKRGCLIGEDVIKFP
jgi:hypothetical protein